MSIENKEQPPKRDLLSELSGATEYRKPSETLNSSWKFGDDNDNEDEGKETTEDSNSTPAVDNTKKSKLSADKIAADSKASAAMIEFLSTLVSEGVINGRYFFKFKSEEREQLDEKILDTPDHLLNEAEIVLKNRKIRLDKRRKEKLENISVSEKQRERMVEAFKQYSELTGETFMTPKSMLNFSIAESFIKAILEAVFD